ncbi:MAG: SecD/SecF family protein translocase subunit [Firmicutes bacterium]|nr:SecD/SecF family protein translocase subunit [Bacillota bacterium]
MSKRSAIVKFCVIGVVVSIALVLTFVSFNIPLYQNGIWQWRGTIGAIESKMGIDLRGGVMVVFNAERNPGQEGNLDDMLRATAMRIETALNRHGFVEADVMVQGTNQIRVEVPGIHDAGQLLDIMGTPAQVEFLPATNMGDTPFLTGANINSVSIFQDPQTFSWGVRLHLNGEGGAAFREAARAAYEAGAPNNYIRRVQDGQTSHITVQSPNVGQNNIAEITAGGGGPGWTRAYADEFRTRLESGLFQMRLEVSERSTIPPTLGQGALLAGIIAFIVSLVFISAVLLWRYRHLGLLAILSTIIFSVIFLFTLALVDMVQLTLPGIAGIVLALAMSVDAMIIIFERIRDEYRTGKKMSVAMQQGFKKSFWTIFDANITTIIAAIVLFFLGTGPIQGFAIVLLLGVVVSMFCSLFVLRQLVKLYLVLNPDNAKLVNMSQDRKIYDLDEYKAVAKKEKRKLNI